MKRSVLLIAFLAIAPAALAQSEAINLPSIERGGEPMVLPMISGQIQVLRTPRSFSEIIIGNSEIADSVAVLSDRMVAISAKKDGYTQFLFIDTDKRVLGSVNVLVSSREENAKHTIRVYTMTQGSGITYNKPATFYCSPEGGCNPAAANFERKEPTTLLDKNPQVNISQNSTSWGSTQPSTAGGATPSAASAVPAAQ